MIDTLTTPQTSETGSLPSGDASPWDTASQHEALEAVVGEPLPRILYEHERYASCLYCGDKFTTASAFAFSLIANNKTFCRSCGRHQLRSYEYERFASEGSFYSATGSDALRSRSWFHATSSEGWVEALGHQIETLHLGSRLTAFSRIAKLCEGRRTSGFILYELRVRDDARLLSLHSDSADEWAPVRSNCVAPYVNDWELPGATSLFAHAAAVEVVGCEVFDYNDLKRSIAGAVGQDLDALKDRALAC